ncbi:MAG: aldehyde ferredoxin oxidoreductase C-terminal domain-containing protein [Bacillota bacterium]|nr:aldehyde ferredoxin oxidoreductase C-terminal domain-containing protein [Bacillota bacterium]
MANILRVNMASKSVKVEDQKEEYQLFGGRNFIAKIMNDEVNPKCDPLGPENKLIISTGLLAGTTAPTSGRISVGGKSPLTGTVKEANAGGTAAQMLARLGLKAIIVEGMPEGNEWYILKVSADGAELLPGDKYAGMNNYELCSALQSDFGDKIGTISIGAAGERVYKNSTVQISDMSGRPSRAAARGGVGAIMGSKKLKAIVLEPAGKAEIEYADKEKFTGAVKAYIQGIKDNPLSGQALPALGTAVLVNGVNALGALPTRNFSSGNFEEAEKISGETLVTMQAERGGKSGHICQTGCPIGCSNIYNDENGNYLTSGFEFETIALVGSNCGISSLDTIAKIDRLCDDFGLDTMETGATIAVCMEAGKLSFGDEKGTLALIQEMIDGTDFGRVLGQGTAYVGKELGVNRIPVVKGQSIAGYDPRALKGTGVTYATSPMGADHTCGNSIGNPTVDPYKKEGQVELSTNLQVGMATFDTLGLCIFSGFCTEDPANVGHLLEMVAARFGGEWSVEKLFGLGVQSLIMEKSFNEKAGFTAEDNRLPGFMYSEPLPPTNNVFDLSDDELSQAIPF